ncbi:MULTISPECIES: YeiH family protein [unclassified Herbaspirillum]|uniref:YeiH family protein n=1 Tax=unclassified Herbaspirillum TaxID=2624150 RepID=UPI000C09936D|nr:MULTISPECIES: YeiH family protein [unclassified Herbaspirillum]MAF04285.1 YeiH family putative sulfate export transporter [Herbaspirillum sp.]MBO14850.1 YeiH family putative sulfate export transporter [Herbaspirillum sp.]|tara:strand:- start:2506 stop:3564 length:1059 start_codon:yes stop_codon:yes gene_type:complete
MRTAIQTSSLPPAAAGLALSGAVAWAAMSLGNIGWLQNHGFSALTVAIVLGILIGNTVYPRLGAYCGEGVRFSKQTLLRAGIILYGFRLTFQDIAHVGVAGVVIDAAMLLSTFGLAWLVGTKLLKLDRDAALLIGAGSSICGAAAVMATEPVLRARSEQVTVAVSTVVIFGSLAIFLYPLLYTLQAEPVWGLRLPDFGVYIGSTVHEVAQVLAAARSIDQHTADVAVITKMVRVMMLAPFLLMLSIKVAPSAAAASGAAHATKKLSIPWFAFAFIGVVVFNSFFPLPAAVNQLVLQADTLMLAMAMAALGLSTHLSALRSAGIKPVILGAVLFAWLVIGGALVNGALGRLLA